MYIHCIAGPVKARNGSKTRGRLLIAALEWSSCFGRGANLSLLRAYRRFVESTEVCLMHLIGCSSPNFPLSSNLGNSFGALRAVLLFPLFFRSSGTRIVVFWFWNGRKLGWEFSFLLCNWGVALSI